MSLVTYINCGTVEHSSTGTVTKHFFTTALYRPTTTLSLHISHQRCLLPAYVPKGPTLQFKVSNVRTMDDAHG